MRCVLGFGKLSSSLRRRWQETLRPVQIGAGCRLIRDARAPGIVIFLARKLSSGDFVEIRVAKILAPIHVRAAVGLRRQVNPLRAAIAKLGQIVGFQNVERGEQHYPA